MLSGRLGLKNERLGCRNHCCGLHHLFRYFRNIHHSLGDAVRWLIALVLTLSLQSTGKDLCSVREFYSIAWGVHDPTERYKQMADWLTRHQYLCKSSDFKVIWNNLSEWAGNADSHQLRGLVVLGYKEALEREKK